MSETLRDAYAGTVDPSELVRRAQAELGRSADATEIVSFNPMRCDDLMAATFEIKFLIDKVLVAGQPFILAGPKKALKTTLLLDMAVALARGGFFLGKFNVPEAVKVGVMTGESGLATIQETLRRICWAAGCEARDLGGNLIIADRVPQFANDDHLDAVRSLLMEYEIEVLIVDPVYLCIDGTDAGNLFAQGRLLGRISNVCQECGCTLILAHHTKKSVANPHAVPELEDISWAGFQEYARQWLLVARREPYQPGTGEHRLWMTVGGSVGHGGLRGLDIAEGTYNSENGRFWQVDVLDGDQVQQSTEDRKEAEKEATRQKIMEEVKKRIVETMASFPEGQTATRIRDTASLHDRQFKPALASLLRECSVVPCELFKPNRKKPYEAYKLAES